MFSLDFGADPLNQAAWISSTVHLLCVNVYDMLGNNLLAIHDFRVQNTGFS